MKTFFKRLVLILAVMLVLAGSAMGYMAWRFNQDPEYWTQNQQFIESHTQEELAIIADNVQNRVVSQMTSVFASGENPTSTSAIESATRAAGGAIVRSTGEGDQAVVIDQTPREITVTPDEANAWLATRFESVAAGQGFTFPEGVTNPMVTVKNGKLVSAFRVQRKGIDRPVSMLFDIKIASSGMATLKLSEIKGGEMALPLEQLASQLGDEAAGEQKRLLAKLEEVYAGKTFDPVFKVDEKRNLRVKAINLSGANIKMTVQTEPR